MLLYCPGWQALPTSLKTAEITHWSESGTFQFDNFIKPIPDIVHYSAVWYGSTFAQTVHTSHLEGRMLNSENVLSLSLSLSLSLYTYTMLYIYIYIYTDIHIAINK